MFVKKKKIYKINKYLQKIITKSFIGQPFMVFEGIAFQFSSKLRLTIF